MNLKEKWNKQNNSIKLLLKKLKRHDTAVVATAVVIATALCGGLIYLSTPVVTATAKEEIIQDELANNEKTVEKLDELKEYLNGIDKTVAENQKSIKSIHEKSDNNKETNEITERMTNNVTEKIVGLDKDMKELRQLISNTNTSIDSLKKAMEKGDSDNAQKLGDSFRNLYAQLQSIENKYNTAQDKNIELINEVKSLINGGNKSLTKEMLAQYNELLAKLEETDAKLSQQNDTSLADYKNQMNSLSNEFNKKFAELGASLTNEMDAVKGDMKDINKNLEDKLGAATGDLQVDLESLRNYIGGKFSNVDKSLEQVFTYVSDGKRLLASALLTKGVTIKPDAKFREIADAIISIKTEYTIDDIPGKIKYTYHYHNDGIGTECDDAMVEEARKGGCYNKAVNHVHTDGCYEEKILYTYTTTLGVERKNDATGEYDSTGKQIAWFYCTYCKRRWKDTNPSHAETTYSLDLMRARKGSYWKHTVEKVQICEHEEGDLEGYVTDCGYVHGQVVGADITFPGKFSDYDTSTENGKGSNAPATDTTPLAVGVDGVSGEYDVPSDIEVSDIESSDTEPSFIEISDTEPVIEDGE